MKLDRYKFESSLSEMQEKVDEFTRQTKDTLQELHEKSIVTVEQAKAVTRSVYNETIQPGVEDLYHKAESTTYDIYNKVSQNVTKFSKGNRYFKEFKEKAGSIMSSISKNKGKK